MSSENDQKLIKNKSKIIIYRTSNKMIEVGKITRKKEARTRTLKIISTKSFTSR